MLVFTLFTYSLLAIYELVPLYKQKHWRDFWVTFIIGVCSLTYALLISFEVNVPSPAKPIQEFIISIRGK